MRQFLTHFFDQTLFKLTILKDIFNSSTLTKEVILLAKKNCSRLKL